MKEGVSSTHLTVLHKSLFRCRPECGARHAGSTFHACYLIGSIKYQVPALQTPCKAHHLMTLFTPARKRRSHRHTHPAREDTEAQRMKSAYPELQSSRGAALRVRPGWRQHCAVCPQTPLPSSVLGPASGVGHQLCVARALSPPPAWSESNSCCS